MEVERRPVSPNPPFPPLLRDKGVEHARLTRYCVLVAWSLTYLFLHGKKALVSKRPGPVALASAVGLQAATYGYYYSTV